MKVLFNHHSPFSLAHGGLQTQIEQTKAALERRGVEVEFMRWWDDRQQAPLIHHFGLPTPPFIRFCQTKHIALVVTHLLSAPCNFPQMQQRCQGLTLRLLRHVPGWKHLRRQAFWNVINAVPHYIVGLEAEVDYLRTVFAVPRDRISRVPLGLPPEYLDLPHPSRAGDHLITTGTITARKRSCELAEMARQAEVTILFVGKPYSEDDPYWHRFRSLIDGRWVRHQPHVDDRGEMIRLLQSARGFVMWSKFENWCLSAHEAAACGLPLLLPDMAWSRERFGNEVRYLTSGASRGNVTRLKEFYRDAPGLNAPAEAPKSWDDAAGALIPIYKQALRATAK